MRMAICIHPFHSSVWSRLRNPRSPLSAGFIVAHPAASAARHRTPNVRASYCLFSLRNRLVRSATNRSDVANPKTVIGTRYFWSGK